MDGNGRWARKRGLPRIEGHRRGVETLRTISTTARELGIQHLTYYAFSAENWQRPQQEIDALMDLLIRFLKRHRNDLVKDNVHFRVIGDPSALPQAVQKELNLTLEATAHCDTYHLNLALNYGSRQETLHAVKAYTADVQAGQATPDTLDWDTFSSYLWTAAIPDPDLLIRTSGEYRISNFLLLQIAYSEMYFTDTPWPEFDKDEFLSAVSAYCHRERRFGKTGEQLATK